MRTIKIAYFTGAAALGLALGTVSNITGAEDIQAIAQREFVAGFAGDKEALERGMKACEEALAEDPENADAMVWHGAGTYFRASEAAQAGDYEKAAELIDKGMAEMNKAVTLHPESPSVRITRGLVLSGAARHGAPDPQSLFETAAGDLEKVIAITGGGWSQMPAEVRAEILLGLAASYEGVGRKEQARNAMKRLVVEHAGTPQAGHAAEWLKSNP